MLNSTNKPLSILMFVLSIFLAEHCFAQSEPAISDLSATVGCPEGFIPAPYIDACIPENYAVEKVVIDFPPGTDCPEGFERPPGVRFCIATNMTLKIVGELFVLEGNRSSACPDGFSVAVGSTICTADNLVLVVDSNEVKLMSYKPRCPKGFHKPAGVRFCIPKNLTSKTLLPPPPPACPPGFAKPPGVNFCIATNILYADENRRNDLVAPEGDCPPRWVKSSNGFCVPEFIVSNSSRTDPETKLIIGPYLGDFEITPCPRGTEEIWWDMPVYDEQGLFVVGYQPTRTCIPEDLEPEG